MRVVPGQIPIMCLLCEGFMCTSPRQTGVPVGKRGFRKLCLFHPIWVGKFPKTLTAPNGGKAGQIGHSVVQRNAVFVDSKPCAGSLVTAQRRSGCGCLQYRRRRGKTRMCFRVAGYQVAGS